jgi:hypothetical protein
LDITRTTRRYAHLSRLDFDALDYRGLWDWRLGRRWSGTLGTKRSQSLADYSEFHDSSRRNVLTVERTFLSALTASLQRQRQSSTDPTVQFEARIASLGASARF